MSEDVKTFVFPNNGFGNGNLDPNLLLGMNGGGWGGGMNNPFWAIILLAFLRQWGWDGNNGGNGCLTQNQLSQIQETLNTNQGNTLLMNAITGNATNIKELASVINCDFNAVQTAIQGVQSAICNLGSKTDMNAMQIVNAINSGNSMLANQLSSCCCDVKQLVTTQGYEGRLQNLQQSQLIQNGFSQIGFASADQTCQLKQNGNDNTNRIIAKLDQIEDSRKDREIATLTAQLATVNARAERAAELAPITQKLNDIICKQPNTVTVPYQPFVTVPNCVAYQAFGLNPYGYNNGQWS